MKIKIVCGTCDKKFIDFSCNGRKFCSQKCYWLNSGGSYKATTGYIKVNKTVSGKKKVEFEHRLVYEKYFGKIPKGKVIDHIDGNRTNNKIENLRLVTPKENGRFASKWFYVGKEWWKPCKKCNRSMPVKNNFHKRYTGEQEYVAYCKKCCSKINTSYRKIYQ